MNNRPKVEVDYAVLLRSTSRWAGHTHIQTLPDSLASALLYQPAERVVTVVFSTTSSPGGAKGRDGMVHQPHSETMVRRPCLASSLSSPVEAPVIAELLPLSALL